MDGPSGPDAGLATQVPGERHEHDSAAGEPRPPANPVDRLGQMHPEVEQVPKPRNRSQPVLNPTIGVATIASAKGRQSSCSWGYSNGGAAGQCL